MSDQTPTDDAPRKPPQRFRRTRIAVSVFFGILTVLLCVLWVRSYSKVDSITLPFSTVRNIMAMSMIGIVHVHSDRTHQHQNWERSTQDIDEKKAEFLSITPRWKWRMMAWPGGGGNDLSFYVPTWSLAAICLLIASALAIPSSARFSLRTLLIATTLVAVVLGTIVCAFRE